MYNYKSKISEGPIMLNEFLISLILPLLGSAFTIIVGYFVFRNEVKNRNKAVDTRFINMAKDISKNDKRLREEFSEQNHRNDKTFNKVETDVLTAHNKLIEHGQELAANHVSMGHLQKMMESVSEKMDTIISVLASKDHAKS